MKIIDKINAMEEGACAYSYEYFPPKTDAGVANLFARIDRMAATAPLFVDCTWGAGGSTSDLTMEICKTVQKYMGVDIMMHLTCTNMPIALTVKALTEAKENGIQNILALRGDPPAGKEWTACEGGFSNAVDLVKFIRKEHGDFFGIGVAGYPEGHTQAMEKAKLDEDGKEIAPAGCGYTQDLQYLKEKIDAGADFIVTQLFYDMDCFFKFVDDCRAIGITCPIVPGMMPIQAYKGFYRMCGFCDTKIPDQLRKDLEAFKDDDAGCKEYGVKLATEMCNQMRERGITCFHFYTLNLEKSAIKIVTKMGLYKPEESVRELPWRPSTGSVARTESEKVRPIFWANRPRSYLTRTENWDEFPNGRWGDSTSAAFGDLKDYYLSRLSTGLTSELKIKKWGTPTTVAEVGQAFVNFCKGEKDCNRLPWSEQPISLESADISEQLVALNSNGILTINSQPQVNGAPSTHPAYGWGGGGGYVYQKGYLEFFCCEAAATQIVANCASLPSVSYIAVDKSGSKKLSNCTPGVNAVTWGVFPGREVIQPTVVSEETFMVWKDEAFDVWRSEWASAYEADSPSAKVLGEVADSFMLVTLVENDYVGGDLFKAFAGIVDVAAGEELTAITHKDGTTVSVNTVSSGTTTTVTHSDGTKLCVSTSA